MFDVKQPPFYFLRSVTINDNVPNHVKVNTENCKY